MPQPSLPLVSLLLTAQRLAAETPMVSAPGCNDVGDVSDCEDCSRDYDDGPHGRAHVPSTVSVDDVSCCTKHALSRGATARQIAAAMGVLSCDRCCETLDVQDPQIRYCVECSLEGLRAEFPAVKSTEAA